MISDGQDVFADGAPLRRAAIVLAAGASTRLGQPKQLVRMGGKSLLRRAVESAVASGASPVIVVLGAAAERLAKDMAEDMAEDLAGLPVLPVTNPAWREGMGSSLRCGVEALANSKSAREASVLLMVCDQPWITAEHLRAMWERHAACGKVIAARHGDGPGVPAVFPARYVAELKQVTGDKGARSVLRSLPDEEIELVELPEAGFDLDTPEDLERFAGDIREVL